MRVILFLELCVIFASSFLLTTQLFYNCLNETHFIIIGCIGLAVAGLIVLAGYEPSGTTVALYFFLSLAAMGFILYHLAIGYIVYDFGEQSRNIFIENTLNSELKSLPKYADRSQRTYDSFEFVCRHEAFAFVPGEIELAYQAESCYGPLAFLLWDEQQYPRYLNCQASEESWALEIERPGSDQFLCIDTRRLVVVNADSIGEAPSCR